MTSDLRSTTYNLQQFVDLRGTHHIEGIAVNEEIGQVAFSLLQVQDLLFNGAAGFPPGCRS